MASLYDIRSVLICLLAFVAFLRFDELAKLVRSDVEIDSEKLQLFIESSKTDKYRDGAWVVVTLTGKVICPVNMMNRYLDKAQLSHDSPLFCQLTETKYGYKARARGLSYTRLRELVIETFRGIVLDLARIGTHSVRSGGATAAANAGVPDRLFLRHGRWSSVSAKDGYVKDSLASRLSVSMALGIKVFCFGLARGTLRFEVQLAWGFPLRGKWAYGEDFHPAVVPQPHFGSFCYACNACTWFLPCYIVQ